MTKYAVEVHHEIVDLDCTDDRERFDAAYSKFGELLPPDAPPPEKLRGYLVVDDIAVVDRAVRSLLPTTIRFWAQSSAKAHRLRWRRRADWVEDLPHVQSWPARASDVRRMEEAAPFHFMKVYREMPAGWDEFAEHMTGTGDLGWLFWSVSQMTENAAWIEEIRNWRLV